MHEKPKKRLGQNFLFDKNIQKKIIESCALKADDIVIEIGAGTGELTGVLAKKVKKVYAIEIDKSLFGALQERFKGQTNIEIIHQDILKFNLSKKLGRLSPKVKVVGNIPYYISSPIIEHLFKHKSLIDTIFITVQREFAKRMAACSCQDDYGSFSCFVQYHTLPKILFLIKRGSFFPMPNVDSCFVSLKVRSLPAVRVSNENSFFKIIRLAFNQRRKTLRNSLRGVVPFEKLERFFADYCLKPDVRPEVLSLQDFANLSNL